MCTDIDEKFALGQYVISDVKDILEIILPRSKKLCLPDLHYAVN